MLLHQLVYIVELNLIIKLTTKHNNAIGTLSG